MGLVMLGCDLFVTELLLGAVAQNAGGDVGEEKALEQGAEILDTMEFRYWHQYLLPANSACTAARPATSTERQVANDIRSPKQYSERVQ